MITAPEVVPYGVLIRDLVSPFIMAGCMYFVVRRILFRR